MTAVKQKAAKNPMKKKPIYIIGIDFGKPSNLLGPTRSIPSP